MGDQKHVCLRNGTQKPLYLSVLSAFACSFEVTVTSVSLPPFVSRRGLSNTNQRLSQVTSTDKLG